LLHDVVNKLHPPLHKHKAPPVPTVSISVVSQPFINSGLYASDGLPITSVPSNHSLQILTQQSHQSHQPHQPHQQYQQDREQILQQRQQQQQQYTQSQSVPTQLQEALEIPLRSGGASSAEISPITRPTSPIDGLGEISTTGVGSGSMDQTQDAVTVAAVAAAAAAGASNTLPIFGSEVTFLYS
jgi:hypothetical protein